MEENYSFDPMTGERIVKKAEEAEEVSYDPMTGERIVKKAEEVEEVSYDPMTGERIVKKAEEAEEVSYDPMTGERIVKKAGKQRKKIGLSAGAGKVLGAVVALCIIVAFVSSGAIFGKSGKVGHALSKTISDAEFMCFEDVWEIVRNKQCGINAVLDAFDQQFKIIYSQTDSKKAASVAADIPGVGKVDGIAVLSDESLHVFAPFVHGKILEYNYKSDDNTGWISMVDGGKFAYKFNNYLEIIYSGYDGEPYKNLKKDIIKKAKQAEFEKVPKSTFEVDGKKVKCKGYKTVITSDDVIDYMDIIEKYYGDKLDEDKLDIDYARDPLSLIKRRLIIDRFNAKEMQDEELTFYIRRNRIVAIELYADKTETTLQFNNSKNPLQKITLTYSDGYDNEEYVWEGEKDGSKMTYSLEIEGKKAPFELTYDKKSGEFSVEVDSDLAIEGTAKKKGSDVTYTIEKLNVEGKNLDVTGELTFTLSPENISIGDFEVFDVGKAPELILGNMYYSKLAGVLESIDNTIGDALYDLY